MSEEHETDLRQGAKAAAAAAAVGAAVGVARAIATRAETAARPRDEEPEETEEPGETEDTEAEHEPREADEDRAAGGADDRDEEREPARGAAVSEVRRMTEQARALLHELSGVDVDSVSAVERQDGGWRITLEAVEMRRIPDSTDVLATYAVDLDGDGELVRYERQRRYARSQSDGGGR